MGFPRRWSGYLSGAVKSTKILSRLSSKNALTSNSVSRNNPTSSAGDFEWLTQHVISPSESKVSIFYCERPKSMCYSGGSRGGARMALVPLLFLDQTEARRSGSTTVAFNFPCPGRGMSLILTFRLPT